MIKKATLWLFSITLMNGATIEGQTIMDGLLAHYSFSGNANDASGNNYQGVVNGATLTTDRFGNANSAYSFNGTSNYITSPLKSVTTGKITIAAWVKTLGPITTTSGYNYHGVVCSRTALEGMVGISLANIGPGTLEGKWVIGDVSGGVKQTFANAVGVVDDNWHFLVTSYDGNVTRVYIDGVLAKETAHNVALQINANFTIGNDPVGSSYVRYFKGSIDDVRIYNRVLSQSEIVVLKNLTPENCTQKIEVTDTLRINFNLSSYNPIKYDNSIKVYPNPSNGSITIDHGDHTKLTGYKINILNALGESVFSEEITQSKVTIDPNTWSGAGIYVLRIIDNQNYTLETRKIVLE